MSVFIFQNKENKEEYIQQKSEFFVKQTYKFLNLKKIVNDFQFYKKKR